jgi:hypothetical protein
MSRNGTVSTLKKARGCPFMLLPGYPRMRRRGCIGYGKGRGGFLEPLTLEVAILGQQDGNDVGLRVDTVDTPT